MCCNLSSFLLVNTTLKKRKRKCGELFALSLSTDTSKHISGKKKIIIVCVPVVFSSPKRSSNPSLLLIPVCMISIIPFLLILPNVSVICSEFYLTSNQNNERGKKKKCTTYLPPLCRAHNAKN